MSTSYQLGMSYEIFVQSATGSYGDRYSHEMTNLIDFEKTGYSISGRSHKHLIKIVKGRIGKAINTFQTRKPNSIDKSILQSFLQRVDHAVDSKELVAVVGEISSLISPDPD